MSVTKKKLILLLFLFLTYLFALWQLDLIRDQFIRAGIYYQDFNKAMWTAQFGFPPFCWFGIWFSLQTSFDLMYFLQASVVFILVSWVILEMKGITSKIRALLKSTRA